MVGISRMTKVSGKNQLPKPSITPVAIKKFIRRIEVNMNRTARFIPLTMVVAMEYSSSAFFSVILVM